VKNYPIPIDWYCDDQTLNHMYKAHAGDAGFDICAAKDTEIADKGPVSTGLHVAIPSGFVGIVKPRSGLTFNTGYNIGAGVIDSGYRGEILVFVFASNSIADGSMEPRRSDVLRFNKGDRIAQLVIVPVPEFQPQRVASLEQLGTTDRGQNGFGSSGGA